jgi:hypothetical protein
LLVGQLAFEVSNVVFRVVLDERLRIILFDLLLRARGGLATRTEKESDHNEQAETAVYDWLGVPLHDTLGVKGFLIEHRLVWCGLSLFCHDVLLPSAPVN